MTKSNRGKPDKVGEKITAHIKKLLEYEKGRTDYTNGWSGSESGPCCKKCRMDREAVAKSGRAVPLRLMIGCTDPFQINCKCHVPHRKTARKARISLLKKLLWYLEVRPDLL